MFTHDEIWMAMDRLAEAKGLSPSGLARLAGLDATAFNRSKRISPNGKPRWPSTESIAKILDVTDSTMSDLFSLMNPQADTKAIPVIGFAALNSGRIAPAKNHDTLPASLNVSSACVAVTLEDNLLAPLFRDGATLVIDPSAKPKADDRVVFYTTDKQLKGGIVTASAKRGYTIALPESDDSAATYAEGDLAWIARILWSSH